MLCSISRFGGPAARESAPASTTTGGSWSSRMTALASLSMPARCTCKRLRHEPLKEALDRSLREPRVDARMACLGAALAEAGRADQSRGAVFGVHEERTARVSLA